jgi:hypothetical protein
MIHIAVIAVFTLVAVYMITQGSFPCPLLVIAPIVLFLLPTCAPVTVGGKPKTTNALVEFTLGEFKRLGGFTTLGESVCRAAIYLQTKPKYGAPLLLKTVTGETVPWLRYRTVDLEIDGLDEKHRIAFEYDGPQHYSWAEWKKMGHRARRKQIRDRSENVLDFYRARFYDRWKTELCRQRDIHLIRISTWTSFDAMRAVVAHAIEHPFTEGRPRDDADVIDALHEVDIRNSTHYPRLTWKNTSTLRFSTAAWSPHPYRTENLYTTLFREELRAFTDAVHRDLLDLMPTGRPEDRSLIEQKLCDRFDQELDQLDAYNQQVEDVRCELHRVAREVAEQLTH